MSEHHESTQATGTERFATLGTLALAAGLLLILARALESTHGFPAMPRFWYQNDSLWWLVGLAGVAAGSWLLGKSEPNTFSRSRWKPTQPGKRFRRLVIYTRDNCPLCEEAEELMQGYVHWLPPITQVNIDSDPRLVDQFGKCVPVVELDGKVRFKGRINEVLLRRLIEGTTPVEGTPSSL